MTSPIDSFGEVLRRGIITAVIAEGLGVPMDKVVQPFCPGCDQPPMVGVFIGENALLCHSAECRVFSWDPLISRDEFWATAQEITLPSGSPDDPVFPAGPKLMPRDLPTTGATPDAT